ncbi:glycosyltransferase [Echinicola soli]|uniref:Glycosyltransferase n=1 Tax=Echinicola soli TaxID=2591634 RepID=A0A514CJA2_9BACT|nr:glycosyltransferase [Echinicola soli]QDH79899.1 glycosyltransferase [Echinicola soli]
MKLHKWIDKYNKRYCYKINSKFYRGKDRGYSNLYRFHPKFYLYYLVRITAIFVGFLILKKNIISEIIDSFSRKRSAFYNPDHWKQGSIRVQEIILTLFGYRYFVPNGILPLLKEKEILTKRISFDKVSNPEVSIIIPVYNQLAYTYNCLQSILNHPPHNVTFEILVIDDCSNDSTEHFFTHNTVGIKYTRNSQNQGFLLNCNTAAKIAKGNFLYFLNNDTQVTMEWLDHLTKLFNNEDVGCVGSKLVYGHGLLQEAGGIIFCNASGANYGRNDLTDRPRYNYIREVDYCSGASLMIKKADFDFLGGFDERYTPAYYEDTDLCFAVRNQLGKKVIYSPLSEVIHFEGISSGKIAKKGSIKNYQNVNKLKFAEKWNNSLKQHLKEPDLNHGSRRLLPNKRMVFIDNIIPAFDKNSGSLRAFQLLKLIRELGYHITFVPDDANKTQPYFNALTEMGVEVLFRYPNRPGMIRELSSTLEKADVIWICRPEMNIEFSWLFNKYPKAKWIYDTVDLHHLRLKRQAIQTKDKDLEVEAEKVKEQELSLAKQANFTITVTNDEKIILEKEGIQNVCVIPNVHEPIKKPKDWKFDQRKGILFIGAYDHHPNIDAVQWLVNEIMPEVWKELPNIKVTLLGSKPTIEVLTLKSNQVNIPGFVQDVSSYFVNHKIFVAPLRYGAGMKGKIGQSLAYKLPVITSNIGAEGMGLVEGKNVMIANTKDEFIKKILYLYQNEQAWSELSKNSLEALKPYSIASVKKNLQKII